ncbi:MAG: hypothetical protein R3C52_01755 [Hyphomonadaceae bacterium]
MLRLPGASGVTRTGAIRMSVMCSALALMAALSACQKSGDAAGEVVVTTASVDTTGYARPQLNSGEPKDGDVRLESVPPTVAGAFIDARWYGPGNEGDYVDIVPSGYTTTSGEISYAYVRETTDSGLRVRAPINPGQYEVRYVLQMPTERLVKAAVPLEVIAATATLEAPEAAQGGETLSVDWTGPAGEGDYIDIVPENATATTGEIAYAYTRNGNPASLRAPGETGAYKLRYVLEGPDGRRVIASKALAVTTPEAALTTPEAVEPGADFEVTWTGPGYEGDYVDLVPKGYEETSGELAYFYTRSGETGSLKAPDQRGEYDIRYVLEAPGGRMVLAQSSLTVE